MLSNRIKELLEHMKEVKAGAFRVRAWFTGLRVPWKEGRAPKNPEVLRQTLSICQARVLFCFTDFESTRNSLAGVTVCAPDSSAGGPHLRKISGKQGAGEMPRFDSSSAQEFCGEYNDATLVVLLATLTKACIASLNMGSAGLQVCQVSCYLRSAPTPLTCSTSFSWRTTGLLSFLWRCSVPQLKLKLCLKYYMRCPIPPCARQHLH